jgi:dihydrofolate reductase
MSLDGYVTGPDDGPGKGLGEGGERLHYWVFGGPWSYEDEPSGSANGPDREFLDDVGGRTGAVIGGRATYEAAGAWGGENPWGIPFFILTHRTEDQPPSPGFTFVTGLDAALDQARSAAAGKDVEIMGGADTIRQALAAGVVDELFITVAPVVLGAGKRLFEGFDQTVALEQQGVTQSPWATHLRYRVVRS